MAASAHTVVLAGDSDEDMDEPPAPSQVLSEMVPDLPFAKTAPNLRRLHLAVVLGCKALVCTLCYKKSSLMTVNEAVAHAGSHRPAGTRTPTLATIEEIIRQYDVHTGPLNDISLPDRPVPPLEYLQTEEAWRCEHCELKSKNVLLRSTSARRNHFRKRHGLTEESPRERRVLAQAFSSHRDRLNFEVLADIPANAMEAEPLHPDFTTGQILEAFKAMWKPLPARPAPPGDNLKDTQPFLVFAGFQDFIAGWTVDRIADFLSLLSIPGPDDELLRVYDAAVKYFREEQALLGSVPDCHRKLVMKDDKNPSSTFVKLQTESSQIQYGQCWGGIHVFLTRVYRRLSRGEDTFGIVLTNQQASAASRILDQSESNSSNEWDQILLDTSCKLWRGDGPNDFEHLARNKYSDVTLVYSIGLCLRPGGFFHNPRECGHRLAPLKYLIRYSLLSWVMDEWTDKGHPITWLDTAIPVCLDRLQLCPFAEVANVISLANRYADTSTALGTIHWTGEDEVTLDVGSTIQMTQWRSGIRTYIHDMRRQWFQKVFKGIPLPELGLNVSETTPIFDRLSSTQPNYSFVTDDRNPFHSLQFSLGNALLTHPNGGRMHRGIVNGQLQWDWRAVEQWFQDLNEATLMLMGSVHAVGGQPPRGEEVASWSSCNTPGRPRSVYVMAPGSVGILGQYNKTSATTKFDKPNMHCVPWLVGEIIVAMMVLVTPLAGVLVEPDGGPDARYIHQTFAFPLRGRQSTSEELSAELRRSFERYVGAESIGLRNYRQFANTVEDHLLPWLKDSIQRRFVTIGDRQSGHSRQTALIHYGVEAGRLLTFTHLDYLAFWSASLVWAGLFLEQTDFTEKEWVEVQASRHGAHKPTDGLEIDYDILSTKIVQKLVDNPQALASLRTQLVQSHIEPTSAQDVPGNQAISNEPSSGAQPDGSALNPPPQSTTNDNSTGTLTVANVSNDHVPRPKRSPADIAFHTPPAVTKQHKSVLKTFTGNSRAEWSCIEQAHAFALVTNPGRRSLLVVLPTGAGKSLLFLGPPLMERGITVVIIPLRALLDDQLRTASRLGIRAQEWTPSIGEPDDGVVFISVEKVEDWFRNWCVALMHTGRLNRIVMDEAHLVLETEHYRSAMANMLTIPELRVPILLLTATLPPIYEVPLLARFGDPSVRVVRTSTQRANISYHVCQFRSQEDAFTSLISHARRFELQLAPRESILIACRWRWQVDAVAEQLPGCRKFRSGRTEEERLQSATDGAAWLAGDFPLLAATSAMGTGTNNPNSAKIEFSPKHCGALRRSRSPVPQSYVTELSGDVASTRDLREMWLLMGAPGDVARSGRCGIRRKPLIAGQFLIVYLDQSH